MRGVFVMENSLHRDFLDEDLPQEGYKISSKEEASWAVKKIAKIVKEQKENNKLVQTEIEKIQNWCDRENEKLQGTVNWFTKAVESWFRPLHEADERIKTMSLPSGEIKIRKQPVQYTQDVEALLEWIDNDVKLEEYVKVIVTRKPDWSNLKKQTIIKDGMVIFKPTGEIIESITVQEVPDKFEIKVVN